MQMVEWLTKVNGAMINFMVKVFCTISLQILSIINLTTKIWMKWINVGFSMKECSNTTISVGWAYWS